MTIWLAIGANATCAPNNAYNAVWVVIMRLMVPKGTISPLLAVIGVYAAIDVHDVPNIAYKTLDGPYDAYLLP